MPLKILQNLNFYNVKDYGAVGDGSHDDTTAITAAITAANTAGGGTVFFPGGTYITTTQLLYSKVHLRGAGIEATILQLKNGANADLLQGSIAGYAGPVIANIAATNATGSTGGIYNWSVVDLTLDGNKSNQSGTSYGIRQYGYGFLLRNLRIRNCLSDGIYSDWNGGGTANPVIDNMEAQVINVKVHNCGTASSGNVGIRWAGPHDSQFTNVLSYSNSSHGIHVGPNATAMLWLNSHSYSPAQSVSATAWLIEGGYGQYVSCIGEGSDTSNVVVLAGECTWVGSHIFGIVGNPTLQAQTGIQLGQTAGGTPYPGSVNQSAGLTTAVVTSGCFVEGIFSLNNGGSINFANETNNNVDIQVYQTSGNVNVGAPNAQTSYRIAQNGLTTDGTLGKGGGMQFPINANKAATWNDRTNDVFNINTTAKKVELVNNAILHQFSDTSYGASAETFRLDTNGLLRWYSSGTNDNTLKRGAAGVLAVNNALATGITSGSAQTPSTGSPAITIGSPALGVIRVAPTANVTGATLTAGVFGGQQVTIINEAAFTITFAASGTSNVSGGTSVVIGAAGTASSKIQLVWDNGSGQNLWY